MVGSPVVGRPGDPDTLPNILESSLDKLQGFSADVCAMSMLLRLKQQIGIATLLGFIANLSDDLRPTVPSAYRHDNGYLKIPLWHSARSGATLRLNFWEHELESMENIHDHRWAFCSWVVHGDLFEQQFCASDTGDELRRYEYGSRSDRASYDLAYGAIDRVAEYANGKISTGTLYHRPGSILHRTGPMGHTAITLQITYCPVVRPVIIYRSLDEPLTPGARPAPSLSRTETHEALCRAIALIEQDGVDT